MPWTPQPPAAPIAMSAVLLQPAPPVLLLSTKLGRTASVLLSSWPTSSPDSVSTARISCQVATYARPRDPPPIALPASAITIPREGTPLLSVLSVR